MNTTIRRWNCDSCPEMQELTHYSLPDGWMWLHKDGEIQHACPSCVTIYKGEGWGVAKREATQLTNLPGQFIQ